eukprot:TRINITY_DN3256_c0_g1_i5.p1 TRINITY_DN3256_c0_g1~~TRINITY_DN3256_c0_g1_i5.p1  ORF type:complete len:635 (+),score=115.07 TRINITY_DN3256_c0_g1_i5:68-1906(+)
MIAKSALGLGLLAATHHAAELTSPAVLNAADGQHSLSIGAVPFATYGFDSFGYNGGIPGPTFRMKPGESLQIELSNDLNAAGSVSCTSTPGEFCNAANSNLHTHGLHVSSKGKEDGLDAYSDDILADIAPGSKDTYSFAIPANHMGGTHWYHPHLHHATALQAGGGAAGMLIVEDPEGYLPTEYSSMIEKTMFISGHNLMTLQTMAQSASSDILENAADTATGAGKDTNVFLVNGQLDTTISVNSGTWYRFRMVYAAVEQQLQLSVSGDGTCDLKLMAKDGVYLDSIPRDITTIYLFPGARADVAVSCTCTTYPCTAMLGSAGRRLQRGGGGGGPAAAGAGAANVQLLELSIADGGATAPTLPTFTPVRPCYLVDLRSATPTARGNLNMAGGARAITYDGTGQSMTYANTHANGGTMRTWASIASLVAGSVYEMEVNGAAGHPFHMHVNPYQITSITNMPGAGYFTEGDWHDTLMLPDDRRLQGGGGGGAVTVRYQTDVFTGKVVVHCHILEHEDEGMMNIIEVTGTEGATWAGAEGIDSTCYRGAFPSPSPSPSPTPSPTPAPTPAPTPSPTPSPSPDSSTTSQPPGATSGQGWLSPNLATLLFSLAFGIP